MLYLIDAVIATTAAVFFVWDERKRRRERGLRDFRIRELERATGMEPRERAGDLRFGPGVAIPLERWPPDPALLGLLRASQRRLGTHTRWPGAQLGDALPDGRVVVATRGDEATLAWPSQIKEAG